METRYHRRETPVTIGCFGRLIHNLVNVSLSVNSRQEQRDVNNRTFPGFYWFCQFNRLTVEPLYSPTPSSTLESSSTEDCVSPPISRKGQSDDIPILAAAEH